jgi:hypothetical protein
MAESKNITQSLDLVSIFHYVLAALIYLKGAFSFIFIGIGTIAMAGLLSDRPNDMHIGMLAIAMIFYVGPMFFLCLTWTLATLVLIAGKRINKRTNLAYCQIIAGLECLCVPFGTILGIFTLITLTKSDVKDQFDTQIQ